jgi:putative ABC transport system permease protein
MLRHQLKLAFQSLRKSRSAFLINLIGLSTGLACALLIYIWIMDELRMDRFHEKDDRFV